MSVYKIDTILFYYMNILSFEEFILNIICLTPLFLSQKEI